MREVKIYTLVMGEKEILNFKHGEEQRLGQFVKYKDYAALETKCAALAAENATLNDKMNRILVWPGIEFYSSAWEFCNLDGNDALELMCDNKTPATDAFLDEVRAQGVDMFAQWCRGELDFTLIDEDVADAAAYEECVKRAEYFSAQIRKGGEQK